MPASQTGALAVATLSLNLAALIPATTFLGALVMGLGRGVAMGCAVAVLAAGAERAARRIRGGAVRPTDPGC
jgi:hypothetical protein